MEISINETQWKVFKALLDSKESLSIREIMDKSNVDHPMVMATLMYGQEQGWLTIEEQSREELLPSETAEEQMKLGFPERRILPSLAAKGCIAMRHLAQIAKEKGIPMNEVIKWGSMRGWVEKDNGDLAITEKGREALDQFDDDERAMQLAIKRGTVFLDELLLHKIDVARVKKLLRNRSSIAKIKTRTIRVATINI